MLEEKKGLIYIFNKSSMVIFLITFGSFHHSEFNCFKNFLSELFRANKWIRLKEMLDLVKLQTCYHLQSNLLCPLSLGLCILTHSRYCVYQKNMQHPFKTSISHSHCGEKRLLHSYDPDSVACLSLFWGALLVPLGRHIFLHRRSFRILI